MLTCPTTNCFDGLPDATNRVAAGRALRVFGDKFQISKVVGGQRYWRVPVMEGECLLQESFGIEKQAVGGGNFLILAEDADSALGGRRSRRGRDRRTAGRHPALSRRHRAERQQDRRAQLSVARRVHQRCLLPHPAADDGFGAAGGRQLGARDRAGRAGSRRDQPGHARGIDAACRPGVRAITAGNYGGNLGPHQFHLRQIMAETAPRMSDSRDALAACAGRWRASKSTASPPIGSPASPNARSRRFPCGSARARPNSATSSASAANGPTACASKARWHNVHGLAAGTSGGEMVIDGDAGRLVGREDDGRLGRRAWQRRGRSGRGDGRAAHSGSRGTPATVSARPSPARPTG